MRVIGAGVGRTGTMSLKAALETLGFGPCYHMYELVVDPSAVRHWEPVRSGGIPDWDAMFDKYESTVDWPGAGYWRELAEHYPDAKVVLSTRDPQRWYDSVYNTIYQLAQVAGRNDTEPRTEEEVARKRVGELVDKIIWQGTFHGRFTDSAAAIEAYHRHNAEVRAAFGPERLLDFQVDQGWRPLCDFLGVPVPDTEFPHLNDTETMQWMIKHLQEEGSLAPPPNLGLSS